MSATGCQGDLCGVTATWAEVGCFNASARRRACLQGGGVDRSVTVPVRAPVTDLPRKANLNRGLMHRFRILLCALLTCGSLAVSAIAGAAPAAASHGQALFFEAPQELLSPETRPQAIAQLRWLGVHALRVELPWGSVAPEAESKTKPQFEATNPASYDWGQYDELLAEAKRLKWRVLLTVTSPVPRWATSNRSAPYVTNPDDLDFKQFMTAVARHYGSEVSLFAIWNEPNHPQFLRPQFNSKGMPASPRIYRGLFQSGYEGLKGGGIKHPKVLMGETAPIGYDSVRPKKGPLHDVAPLAFMRGALCLNVHWHKSRSCGALPAFGYAHHAYTTAVGPFEVPPNPDNVTIGVLGRLSSALDKAAKAHALRKHMPIFLTEFGVQSKPNKFLGVAPSKQAELDAIAERIAWENPRVAAFSQYLLKDDPLGGRPGSGVHGGYIGFQTGLEYESGRKKPLYFAFPVPLTVTKAGGHFNLWGGVLPAHKSTRVTILAEIGQSSRYRKIATARTDNGGWWHMQTKANAKHFRVLWKAGKRGPKHEGPPIGAYRFVR